MNIYRVLCLLLLSPLAASAAPIGRTYIPSGGAAQVAALYAGVQAAGFYGLKTVTADMLHPMAMNLMASEQLRLVELLKAPEVDRNEVNKIIGRVDAVTVAYAKRASYQLMFDEAKGEISDEDIRGSRDFAYKYLTAFGLYLEPRRKAEVLQAAAKLETRRLALEESKQKHLDVVMKGMARALAKEAGLGWSDAVFDRAAQGKAKDAAYALKKLRPDASLPWVQRRMGPLLRSAAEKGDSVAFDIRVAQAYRHLEAALLPGLDLQAEGMPAPRERAFIASAERQAEQLHAFIEEIRASTPNELFRRDNDVRRRELLELIRRKAQLSRWRAGNIESKLPVEDFEAVRALVSADDGRIVPHLGKIGEFYDLVLDNAELGTVEYLAYARDRMEKGFSGRVAGSREIGRIWSAALARPGNAARWSRKLAVQGWLGWTGVVTAVASAALLYFGAHVLFVMTFFWGLFGVLYFFVIRAQGRAELKAFLAGPGR